MNIQDWEVLKAAGGLRMLQAFNKVWWTKERLTKEEGELLKDLFAQYPLGKDNFKTWSKQTTRQLFEKATISKENTNVV